MVHQIRRAYHIRSVGHTGTLDPFATGLLVMLLGRATRLARFVEGDRKTYLAVVRLGVQTTTDDRTGELVATTPGADRLPIERVDAALTAHLGAQHQRPPEFSAKLVDGVRSYALARRGQAVALAEVSVTVHAIERVAYAAPDLTFRVTVSAGTYIRALARDIGEQLGVGGHLTALRRESIGGLRVDGAIDGRALDGTAPLLPPLAVLGGMRRQIIDDAARVDVAHGRRLADAAGLAGPVALVFEERLVAVATAADGWLHPAVVLEAA